MNPRDGSPAMKKLITSADGKRRDRRWHSAFVGNSQVGKTQFVRALRKDVFTHDYDPTIEDVCVQHLEVCNEYTECLNIMDTSGQEEYMVLTDNNIASAAVVFIFIDYASCDLTPIKKYTRKLRSDQYIYIVATQTDKVHAERHKEHTEELVEMIRVLFRKSLLRYPLYMGFYECSMNTKSDIAHACAREILRDALLKIVDGKARAEAAAADAASAGQTPRLRRTTSMRLLEAVGGRVRSASVSTARSASLSISQPSSSSSTSPLTSTSDDACNVDAVNTNRPISHPVTRLPSSTNDGAMSPRVRSTTMQMLSPRGRASSTGEASPQKRPLSKPPQLSPSISRNALPRATTQSNFNPGPPVSTMPAFLTPKDSRISVRISAPAIPSTVSECTTWVQSPRSASTNRTRGDSFTKSEKTSNESLSVPLYPVVSTHRDAMNITPPTLSHSPSPQADVKKTKVDEDDFF